MSKQNINYKNTVKRLRRSSIVEEKINLKKGFVSYFTELEDFEEETVIENINEQIVLKSPTLPDDMINIILEYLPYNIRLLILKRKYNKNYIQSILKKVSVSSDGLTKIWSCANISAELIKIIEVEKGDILNNVSLSCIRSFKKEIKPEKYYKWYIENFTKIIIYAIKNYTIIYKKNTSWQIKNVINYIEHIMLHIYAHLIAMK